MIDHCTPEQLYTEPQSLFAANFMGMNNTFTGRVVERRDGEARLEVGGRSLWGRQQAGAGDGASATGVDYPVPQPGGLTLEAAGPNRVRLQLARPGNAVVTTQRLGGGFVRAIKKLTGPTRGALLIRLPQDTRPGRYRVRADQPAREFVAALSERRADAADLAVLLERLEAPQPLDETATLGLMRDIDAIKRRMGGV